MPAPTSAPARRAASAPPAIPDENSRTLVKESNHVVGEFVLSVAFAICVGAAILAGEDDALVWMVVGLVALFLAMCWRVIGVLAPVPCLTFARGLRPLSAWTVPVPPGGLWTVELTNAGDRMARIVAVSYEAQPKGGVLVTTTSGMEFQAAIAEAGWPDERAYEWLRLIPGGVLGRGATVRMLEVPLALARAFDVLAISVTYALPLGEHMRLRMTAHPPHGLPPDVTTPRGAL